MMRDSRLSIGTKNAGLPPSMAMIAHFMPEGELVLLAVGINARPITRFIYHTSDRTDVKKL